MIIIDSHIHHYPDCIVANPTTWAKSAGEGYWASLVGPKSAQSFVSTEQLLADMDAAKVAKAVLAGWYWERADTCGIQNDFYAELILKYPDRFVAFASIQALEGDKALDMFKKAIDQGFQGLGECFPALQGFSMQDPSWLKIVELAIGQHMPILLHVTEPVGKAYLGKYRHDFGPYEWLAKTYPEATLIFAHWGGLMPAYELNPSFAKTAKNIYYDTAASPLLYDMRIFKLMVELLGSKKILYGSDYPLRLYPSQQKLPDFERFLGAIQGLGLKKEDLNAILGANMQGLLDRTRSKTS